MRMQPPSDLEKAAHEFLYNRDLERETASTVTPAKNRARDVIKGWLTLRNQVGKMVNGRVDENGHRYYDFDEPLTINGVTYTGIQAQRKTATSIDLDKAEALAREKGIYDKVFPRVVERRFDEDALFLANQTGKITDEELDALEVESESYALLPVKADS